MNPGGIGPGGISPVERWRFTAWPGIKTAAVMPRSLCSTVFLLMVFSLLPVVAESAALSTEYRPIGFEHVDHSDGLSQNSVQAILQDSRGFMWFGTESGLNRFDGYEIRQYRPDRRTPGALPGGHVWQVVEDRHGNLWVATEGGGIGQWQRRSDTFRVYRRNPGHDPADKTSLASDLARALAIDDAGKIWIGYRDSGLDRLDPETGTVKHYRHDPADPNSLASDTVYALHIDRDGRLWIGTERGLNVLDPATGNFELHTRDPARPGSLSHNAVLAIVEDHTGSLWIGTFGGGVNRFDPATGHFDVHRHDDKDPNSLSNDYVRAVYEDSAKRLWVGTEDGLNLLDRDTGRFFSFRNNGADDRSLAGNFVLSLFEDRGGNLWVGTNSGGVSRWNPRTWSLGHHSGDWLESAGVVAFAADGDDAVWIGTMGAGLKRLEFGSGDITELRHNAGTAADITNTPGISDDRVMSLLRDRSGELWIGTMTGGLNRLDGTGRTTTVYRHDPGDPTSLSADGIMSLYEDRRGDVWVGTYGGGVSRYRRSTGTFVRLADDIEEAGELREARVTAITQSNDGAMWIGTDGMGLSRVGVNGSVNHYRHDRNDPESLSSNRIYALHIDAGNRLWIGTGGHGLDRMDLPTADPGSVRFVSMDNTRNELGSVVYGIQSDAAGRLWLSTNNGLGVFDPANGALNVLRRSHGLQGDEFHFGAHHRGADGRLYFGGANGFNVFDPMAVQENASATPVVLVDFQVLNETVTTAGPYEFLESVDLGFDDKVVTFEFAGLNFAQPDDNQYAYRLEGFDEDWVYAGDRRRVSYTNLNAGSYVFHVKAANNDGIWTEPGLSLPIVVQPAPWATGWAYALYVSAGLLALAFGWRRAQQKLAREAEYSRALEQQVNDRTRELEARNEKLEELSRAKSEFLAQMSHEIRTPMNGVLGMTELLLGTELREDQRGFARTIYSSAESLLAIINDILDVSKIEAGKLDVERVEFNIEVLVDETMALLAASARDKGLDFLCRMSLADNARVMGDPLRLRQILVNLLANAVKFTDEGQVVLHCSRQGVEGNSVVYHFEVRDTGVGISPDKHQQIFEAFSQEDGSTTRRFGGTGLGLAICKQLVALMDGTIGVDSKPGEGSTFWFTIQLELADGDADEAVADSRGSLHHSLRRATDASRERLDGRVLLVEDTPVNQTVAAAMLRKLGCYVEVVTDGAGAVERASGPGIDLILMDCQMPGMDGFEATRLIRGNEPAGEHTPIVALTANALAGDRERCLAAGMDDYLAKPFTLKELAATLSRWLPLDLQLVVSTDHKPSGNEPVDRQSLHMLRQLTGPDGNSILDQALGLYLQDSARLVAKLESAISNGDAERVRALSHALKSSSADLGAHGLARLCGKLEHVAQAGSLNGAGELYRQIAILYPRVVAALQAEVQKKSA